MKLSRLVQAAILLLSIGATASSYAQQSPEYASIHGSACQPANLGQSINFNTSWSQKGIRNINALGSGKNFFVVCPVVFTDDRTGLTDMDIYVNFAYSDRESDISKRISCIAQRYKSGAFVRNVAGADTLSGNGSYSGVLIINDVVRAVDHSFNGTDDSVVLVCKLVPQSGIVGVSSDHDGGGL